MKTYDVFEEFLKHARQKLTRTELSTYYKCVYSGWTFMKRWNPRLLEYKLQLINLTIAFIWDSIYNLQKSKHENIHDSYFNINLLSIDYRVTIYLKDFIAKNHLYSFWSIRKVILNRLKNCSILCRSHICLH